MGTTTSCASPTAPSSTHGGRPGQDRFPPRLLLTLQHPRKQTLRSLQHLNADGVLASASAANGTVSSRARRGTMQRTHQRCDGGAHRGARGHRAAVPPRDA
jgi:hypothetical protein